MSTLVVVTLLILTVTIMTAAATAVRSASRIWLRHWAERQITGTPEPPGPAARRPQELLLAAGTGIAAVVFSIGAVLALREDGVALIQYLGAAMVMLLLVGQVIPRAIASRWAGSLLPFVVPVLRVLDAAFGPLLAFAALLARRALSRGRPAPPEAPTDALEDLLREAEAEGIGEAGESEIISGVVEFGEKRVRDVMTPLARVASVSRGMDAAAVAQVVAESRYTRIPVLDGDQDVVGVLHAFDVLVHPRDPLASVRPAATAQADELCSAAMRRMLRDRTHLAVVRDAERLAGIVTLEDLVEELVGDIHDEHDEPHPGAA